MPLLGSLACLILSPCSLYVPGEERLSKSGQFLGLPEALSCLLSELNRFPSQMECKFISEKITTEHMEWGGKNHLLVT